MAMAELFGVQIPAISKHLKNIYESGELQENTTVSKMETVGNFSWSSKGVKSRPFDVFSR